MQLPDDCGACILALHTRCSFTCHYDLADPAANALRVTNKLVCCKLCGRYACCGRLARAAFYTAVDRLQLHSTTKHDAMGSVPWDPTAFPKLLVKAAEAIHALYTHTQFYFAQVYGNLGDSGEDIPY